MGPFSTIGQIVAGIGAILPVQRQPSRVVESFGYPGGSSTVIGTGFGSSITMGQGDEWVAEIESLQSEYPHWWEIGMNFRNGNVYNELNEYDTDGFSYLSWSIILNGESVAGGGPNGLVHTIFVPAGSTGSLVLTAEAMPEDRWADVEPNGYAVRVRV